MAKEQLVFPKRVHALDTVQGFPWRFARWARAHAWGILIVVASLWVWRVMTLDSVDPLTIILNTAFPPMAWLIASIAVSALRQAKPLGSSEYDQIKRWVQQYPHFEDALADWMARGALDSRHYHSLLDACVEQRRRDELRAALVDRQQIIDDLRSINGGALGAKIDQRSLNASTPKPTASTPRPRL